MSLILSAVLFLPCLFAAFIGTMAGTLTIENEWNIKGYKVEYRRDQGFSGGPLMTYQLSKYASIPIFIKNVDSKWDSDTTRNCWIRFDDEKFNFNKCQVDSSYSSKK